MTDEEINELLLRLDRPVPTVWDAHDAAYAIRQLMLERDRQYHMVGYWDWNTGTFHSPRDHTSTLQKLIEVGRARPCYVKARPHQSESFAHRKRPPEGPLDFPKADKGEPE